MTNSFVNIRLKRAKLDASKIRRAVTRANLKALGDAGAIVRDTARASIKDGTNIASPGSPPRFKKRFFARLISTGVDRAKVSAVIGPTSNKRVAGAAQTLRALELGTDLPPRIKVLRKNPKTGRKRVVIVARRKIRVQPRPFMNPALLRARTAIPRAWADSVKGT